MRFVQALGSWSELSLIEHHVVKASQNMLVLHKVQQYVLFGSVGEPLEFLLGLEPIVNAAFVSHS